MHVLIEAFRLFSFYVVIDGAAFRATAVFNLFPPFLLWIAVCFLRNLRVTCRFYFYFEAVSCSTAGLKSLL